MPENTAINQWAKPLLNDADADIVVATNWAAVADTSAFPRFATVSARNSAITSPVEGMLAYCDDTDELYKYTGSAWVGAVARHKPCTANVTLTGTTYVNVTGVAFSVEANSVYVIQGHINYFSTGADDLKGQWTGPAGFGGWWRLDSVTTLGFNVATQDAFAGFSGTGSGDFEYIYGGYITTGGTSGTVQMRAAKFADTGADGTIFAYGTSVSLQKVA